MTPPCYTAFTFSYFRCRLPCRISPNIVVASSAEMSVYIAASYVFPIGLWAMGNVEIMSLVNYLNYLKTFACDWTRELHHARCLLRCRALMSVRKTAKWGIAGQCGRQRQWQWKWPVYIAFPSLLLMSLQARCRGNGLNVNALLEEMRVHFPAFRENMLDRFH